MSRGAWSRQGTGTLTASAILLIVVIVVAGVHLASSARREELILERTVLRQNLLFAARAAADEASYVFETIVNEGQSKPLETRATRLEALLSQSNNGQFLGRELYHSQARVPKEPPWANRFRSNPRGFSCSIDPRWSKHYFGENKSSFNCSLDDVHVECVQFRQVSPVVTEGKLKFSARAKALVSSKTQVIRPYELILPFRVSNQLSHRLEYLDISERRLDVGLKRGDVR